MIKTLEEKQSLFLNKIFTKMFEMVGLKYTKKYCQKDGWYLTKSFDKSQEEEFCKFFIENAVKDFKYSRKGAEKEYQWFTLMYGWTSKRKD